jgi:hypothetical protein
MSREISITYGGPPRIHFFRNFAEEISLALKEVGWGVLSMTDADGAIDQVTIHRVPTRKVKRVLSMVNNSLKHNGFAGGIDDIHYAVSPGAAA